LPVSLPARRRVSQTDPVSDSGFVDEAPGGGEPAPRAVPDRAPGTPPTPSPEPARRRRPTAAAVAFVVLVLGLVGFGLYAWSSRVHADDEAAYTALVDEVDVMDRTLHATEALLVRARGAFRDAYLAFLHDRGVAARASLEGERVRVAYGADAALIAKFLGTT